MIRRGRAVRSWLASGLGLALFFSSPAVRGEPEEVDLVPAEQPNWGPSNLLIGFSALLGGWNYWYGKRFVQIETVPAQADLALYYVRANFQKRFERGNAPARVQLPQRYQTTRKDYVTIRASANGYATTEQTFKSRKVPTQLLIKLEPLPNALTFLGSTHIAGRTSLVFRTTEEAQFQISRTGRESGFVLALTQTADKLDLPPEVSDPLVSGVEVKQVGEDLLIHLRARADLEVRSKARYDPIRKEYLFTLDLALVGSRAPAPDEIRKRLERLDFDPVDPCARAFAAVLRAGIDPALGARAYRSASGLVGLYRRESMRRLGRFDRGRVHTLDGKTLRIGHPIELEMALQEALDVKGYLAFLAVFVHSQDEPETVLRSLLAPDMPLDEFRRLYAAAESARTHCGN